MKRALFGLFGRAKERPMESLSLERKPEPEKLRLAFGEAPDTARLMVVRHEDGDHSVFYPENPLAKLHNIPCNEGNIAFVDIPISALGEEGELVGGTIQVSPRDKYPLEAKWASEEPKS